MATIKITLNELRNIVKQIIKEYDVEDVDRKYPRLPADRKKTIKDFLSKRQVDHGYVLQSLEGDKRKLFLTRDDMDGMTGIKLSNGEETAKIFKNINAIVDLSKLYNPWTNMTSFMNAVSDKYKFNPWDIFDSGKKPLALRDKIGCKFTSSMQHLMTEEGKNVWLTVYLSGVLMKENDKYYPPFTLIINSITIDGDGLGYFVPVDNEGKKFIIDKITKIVLENYKYKGNGASDIFIKSVKIDKNSFYKD